jgi:hypothetical protein
VRDFIAVDLITKPSSSSSSFSTTFAYLDVAEGLKSLSEDSQSNSDTSFAI